MHYAALSERTFLDKLKPRVPLWEHQLAALELSELKSFAYFMEPGCGKTATAINWARLIYLSNKKILTTLVISPAITLENWKREFAAHSGDKLASSVRVLTGKVKDRAKVYKTNTEAQVFVTNYEALDSADFMQAVNARKPAVVIFDECHRLKRYNGMRTKRAHLIADRALYKLILTGSPVLNSPMDLWGQVRCLGAGIFPENFFTFRARYFRDENAGMPKHIHFPAWVMTQQGEKEVREILSRHSIVVKKDEALDLPPIVRKTIYVEMEPGQAKHYRELSKDFLTALDDDRTCVAPNTITKLTRVLQLCSGLLPVRDSKGNDSTFYVGTAKSRALKELLEDLTPHHKVIVWSHWVDTYEEIEIICTELGLKWVTLTGETKAKDRSANIDAFNNDEEVRVLIGNQGAGGIGVNLQAASAMIYYSKDFSLEKDLQSEARAHRAGSERHKSIVRYDLVTKDTEEEKVEWALKHKMKLGDLMLSFREKLPSRD